MVFYFHLDLGKIPILTNIFQTGWNHQPVLSVPNFGHEVLPRQHQRTPLDWAEQEGHLEAQAPDVQVHSIWRL